MPMDKSTFANKKNLNRLLDLVDQQINILDLKKSVNKKLLITIIN